MKREHLELEHYKEEIYHCFRCGFCRELVLGGAYRICPIREELGFETTYARGRIGVARALLEGKIEYTDPLVERIYSCLGCYNCKAHCPTKVDTPSVVRGQRKEIYQEGLRKLKALDEIDANIETYKNPYGLGKKMRTRWAEGLDLPKRGELLYFPGCATAYDRPEIAQALVKILKKAGIDVACLGEEEWCCGIPQIWNGGFQSAKALMEENGRRFEEAGAKTILTSCPDCYNVFHHHYYSMLGKEPFRVIHITEFLLHLMNEGRITFQEEIRKRITYHDPCRLGREAGIFEPPREILRRIPGIQLVEMRRNREHAWCCGGGGVVNLVYPKLSIKIAKNRVQEALETDAEMLVTCCPLCYRQFYNRAWEKGLDLMELIVLAATAMGIETINPTPSP
jgi:heterodisulfide reductase subunit D